jgi:hypothetical protein
MHARPGAWASCAVRDAADGGDEAAPVCGCKLAGSAGGRVRLRIPDPGARSRADRGRLSRPL